MTAPRCALVALAMLWAAPAAAQQSGPAAEAEETEEAEDGFSATLDLVSDYRFRGVSLSDRKPALQAGIEYAHSSGFFAGAWGSTIAETGGAEVETDFYVGYSGTAKGLTYTVTALKYLYPGASGLTYVELQSEVEAELGPAGVAFELSYTPDQRNAVDSLYTAAGLSFDAPYDATVTARIGRENGAYDRKWDWELGLERAFGPLALSASYVGANHRSAGLGKDGKPAFVFGAGLAF